MGTVDQLQQDRIDVLHERCQIAQTQIDDGMYGFEVLTAPKIDLLNAKIEYATDAQDKVAYYNELIKFYEELIEREKLKLHEPARINAGPIRDEPQHLFFESEKIRIQIAKAKLFAEN